jgi:hypothetical protein
MGNMKKSPRFYAVIAILLVAVVGLLIGLGFIGNWIAFLTIAILAILMIVLLSDLPGVQKRSR